MPTAPSPGARWHDEVPGTRWFRADLHLHTLDDHPNVPLPDGISGDPTDVAVREAYARRVLDAAVDQGVEVLGLTPHAATLRPGVSAAWDIVERWRDGTHAASGTAYRDLIYAVYPGFEPNFADGNAGIHMILLFDPEIDRATYERVFVTVMGGRPAWDGKSLNVTELALPTALRKLDDPKVLGREHYLCVAAHPLRTNGLLKRKAHRLPYLSSGGVDALELPRNKTLEESLDSDNKLRKTWENGRALHHASDAKTLPAPGQPASDGQLGHRIALVKLAAPTLQGLRQAFLARDSRLRDPYARDPSGDMVLSDVPEPCPAGPEGRPWLREVRVEGGTSFLRGQVFRLSPDLTCIIGGSMTGKSTLLDGLRLSALGTEGLPPPDSPLRKGVEERARDNLLSGGATVALESPAGDLARPVRERFGLRFFSQGELRTLADDPDGIEHLLFHLLPGRAPELLDQRDHLRELDAELSRLAATITEQHEQLGEAEQAFERARKAREAMRRFEASGADALPRAQQDLARVTAMSRDASSSRATAAGLDESIRQLGVPELDESTPGATGQGPDLDSLLASAREQSTALLGTLEEVESRARALRDSARSELNEKTARVQRALVDAGGSAEDLHAFDAHARAAQHYDSYRAALQQARSAYETAREAFESTLQRRDDATRAHREALQAICDAVTDHYEGRVRVRVETEGRRAPLQGWVDDLRSRGITRWWNSEGSQRASGSALRKVVRLLEAGDREAATAEARALGMSDTVAETLMDALSSLDQRLGLAALRCLDRYRLQWVEDGVTKELEQLSGGRKVAVLLALLLESDDTTPLFIDQPEDELDNRFLNETIIPALHRLKGKRQVVFATHNANIVVNGDADRVIALEATARQGRVYAEGAIEDDAVRDAIVKTLDGGREAFRLRRKKYGF